MLLSWSHQATGPLIHGEINPRAPQWPRATPAQESYGPRRVPYGTLERFTYCMGPATPRVTLYTAEHLHTAVPHCWHSRTPIVHTAVSRENNEHGCVYLPCRAVCKLPGCVEGHPWTQGCRTTPAKSVQLRKFYKSISRFVGPYARTRKYVDIIAITSACSK